MKNTLENEMFDAAVSWCCSNGINVLEPEQLASLVNSLYITVRDADPTPANLVLVPLRPTRAMQDIFQQDDWQWADVLAAAESVTDEQYLFALEAVQQAQPEQHLFEFWWAEYMPDATQEQAFKAWAAAPSSKGVGIEQAQPEPVNAMLVEALEEARNGLAWYQAMYPGATDGSDDEAMERIDAALAAAEHGASNA